MDKFNLELKMAKLQRNINTLLEKTGLEIEISVRDAEFMTALNHALDKQEKNKDFKIFGVKLLEKYQNQ